MEKILIIEDNTRIANMLNDLLTKQRYGVKLAHTGAEGVTYFKQMKFDLIVLDFTLPDKDGMEVLDEIRAISMVPIIALIDSGGKDSVSSLLYAGANDYLTKPFYVNELLTRIEVQLQIGSVAVGASVVENTILHFKDILLDLVQYDAFIAGKPLYLSMSEFDILKCLMENPRKVFTKKELYEVILRDEFHEGDNAVNEHISNIRTKLAMKNPNEDYILTVWGSGYKMQE